MKLLFSLVFISVLFTSAYADTLTLSMDTILSPPSSQVEVSIKADGFTNMAVLEGTIEWDTLGLEFVEVREFGLENLGEDNFGRPNGTRDKIAFSWTEAANEGQSAPNGTVLFKLVFEVIGESGDSSLVQFADEPLDVSAANNLLQDVDVFENDGLVIFFAPLSVSASVTDVTCFGGSDGSISISGEGSTGNYSYHWNTGDTIPDLVNLSAGTYAFTITDTGNAMTLVDSINLISPDSIVISLEETTLEGDTLGSIAASTEGGVGPYSYVWSNDSIGENLTGLENGVYSLTVSDQNGCTATDSIEIDIELSSSLKVLAQQSLQVYPNPTRGLVTITLENPSQYKGRQWNLVNSVGQITKSGLLSGSASMNIDFAGQSPGLYYFIFQKYSIPILFVE
jgi:hypothetical protein